MASLTQLDALIAGLTAHKLDDPAVRAVVADLQKILSMLAFHAQNSESAVFELEEDYRTDLTTRLRDDDEFGTDTRGEHKAQARAAAAPRRPRARDTHATAPGGTSARTGGRGANRTGGASMSPALRRLMEGGLGAD